MGHAKAILSVASEKEQLLLHKRILKEDLNVRKTEYAASSISIKKKKKPLVIAKKDFHIEELAEKMREKLGTEVSIQPKSNHKGRISFDYYSLDDLDRLLTILGISYD